MTIQLLAVDLGKRSFHMHGITADGVVVSRKVSRSKFEAAVTKFDPVVITMEACASAHHWGRRFKASGREIRLVNPRFVKAFVRGSKNDAIDAEAIYDAASRPTMRFGLVTVLRRSLESITLIQGDRRDEEAYRGFQTGSGSHCADQWIVTAACCC